MPNSGHSFFGAGGRGRGCCLAAGESEPNNWGQAGNWNVHGVDAMANSGGGGSGAMGADGSTYTGGAGGSGIVVVEEYA